MIGKSKIIKRMTSPDDVGVQNYKY